MSIQKIVAILNRKAGELEVIEHIRINGVSSKNRDLLAGAFIVDGNIIEINGLTTMSIEIPINNSFKYEQINENIYRLYNRNINLLIRPLES